MKISFDWNKKSKTNPSGILIEECLSQEEANKLADVDFEKLDNKDKRMEVLLNILGEEKALWFNSRLENEVLLKKQKQVFLDWLDREKDIKPKFRNEIFRKITKLERYLDETEMKSFVSELTELKLGVGLTFAEVEAVNNLRIKRDEARAKMENNGDKTDYEIACKELENYMEILINQND